MASLQELKASSPAYADIPDDVFAERIYAKHYADKISREEFNAKVGISPQETQMRADIADPNKSPGIGPVLGIPLAIAGALRGVSMPKELMQNENSSRVSRIAAQLLDPTGLSDETAGIVAGAKALASAPMRASYWQGKEAPILDQAGSAYTNAADNVRAERKIARERNTIIPEVIGGLAQAPLMPIIGAERTAISAATPIVNRLLNASVNAGLYGAVTGAAQGEDIQSRAENALYGGASGAIAGPILSEAIVPGAVQLGRTASAATRYANDALRAVRNPEQAAIENVADRLVAANVDPAAMRSLVLQGESGRPLLSPELARRGFTDEHLGDVVSRLMNGESAATVAADHAAAGRDASPATLQRYYQRYLQNNPTPMNIGDMAQELAGPGGAKPVLRLGRQSYSLASDEAAGNAAARLMNRQIEQPGRIEQIVQGGSGRTFEGEITRLGGELKDAEKIAYAAAHQAQQPFDLRPVLSSARARAHGRAGDIADKMQRAIDLFFKPVMAERGQAPMTGYRIGEARTSLQRAEAAGVDGDRLAQMRRRLRAMEVQDDYSRAMTARKLGEPINDIARYIDARDELSHMTQMSFHEGKATRLTEALTQFRHALNRNVWANNPRLAEADLQFAGNRTAERLLGQGIRTGTSLTPATRDAVREFRKLTPPQQELYRVGFEQKITDDALRVKKGAAAANQFQTDAFDRLMGVFYPRESGPEIYRRGQSILRNLRREAATTNTKNEFLAGSRTAELSSDMERGMQTAKTASAILTMKLGKVWEQLSARLETQLGQQGAAHALEILSTSDPARLLPTLNRLARAAQTSQERQAYVMAIRQVQSNRIDRLPAPIGVVVGDLVNSNNRD
jgi:hypothetical protein